MTYNTLSLVETNNKLFYWGFVALCYHSVIFICCCCCCCFTWAQWHKI